jgi:hypothetical protein
VFSHSRFVWFLLTDVALVLLELGPDGITSLNNVDLTLLAEPAVHTRSLKSQVILHRTQRNLGIFFRGRPADLMLCLDSSLLMLIKVILM